MSIGISVEIIIRIQTNEIGYKHFDKPNWSSLMNCVMNCLLISAVR